MNDTERELDMALADAEQEIRSLKERLTEYEALIRDLTDAMRVQRTWVGLTHSDIDQGLLRSDYALQTAQAWRAGVVFAMTKLKEKNNG